MNFNDEFPSKYLKAGDLGGGTISAIIAGFTRDEEGKINKPIVLFKNATKGWVLNKTNGLTIQAAYGDDMNLWIGRPVELFATMVPFEGKNVPAIRCRIPGTDVFGAPVQEQAPIQPQPADRPTRSAPRGPGDFAAMAAMEAQTVGGDMERRPPRRDAESDLDDEIPF